MKRVVHHNVFGGDTFGILAERFARFFGTPTFIITQTFIVIAWIAFNGVGSGYDPYPFILLNLMFSTQAAYAAPLILLAQTRQVDRDKAQAEVDAQHREEIAAQHEKMLNRVEEVLDEMVRLTGEVHSRIDAMECKISEPPCDCTKG